MLNTKVNLFERIKFRIISSLTIAVKPMNELLLFLRKNITRRYPPVFIVGAPRTGSTILYQILTNYYNFNYISNFASYFYHSLFLGSLLDDIIFNDLPHNSYDSNYGITYGLKSPNECGQFWYRWFPNKKHFLVPEDIDNTNIKKIRKIITSICNMSSKPMIFKNLNNGQRLKIIKSIFPNALIIFIKRDPLFTAQSILKSRIEYYNNKNRWFSVKPRNIKILKKLDYPEQIVKQVFYIEKQICHDISELYSGQSITIKYGKLCGNTEKELARLYKFFKSKNLEITSKKGAYLPELKSGNTRKISLKDYNMLKTEIEKLDWKRYKD